MIRLVARPDLIGAVTSVRITGGVIRLQVFHNGQLHEYYASQVEPVSASNKRPTVSMPELRRGLTSELLRDTSADYLRARNSGRIDYEPYQFRPVLKMVHADRPRILIADDVGVGKTIEACLIMKELQARQRAQRILIICPKPLIVDDKWRSELKRFDEDFVHLGSTDLRFCIDETYREGEWPARFSKVIVPYSLLDERLLIGNDEPAASRRIGLADIAPQPRFDLVIVDEAHHIRNRNTQAYRCVERFIESAEAVVFLSATPLQTSSADLFTLVSMLRDDLVPTERDFDEMLEPNQYFYNAAESARAGNEGWQSYVDEQLGLALATSWGIQVLELDSRVAALRDLLLSDADDHRARVRVVRALEDLNTFSTIVSRTRRRDIGDFTTRKPSAPMVRFTETQQEVYDSVIDLGRRIVKFQTPGMPVEFLLSMLRRQAASSISGLAPLVRQVLEARLDSVDLATDADDSPETIPSVVAGLRDALVELGQLASDLVGQLDPKVEMLKDVVMQKQDEANNKVLVFSTFRHTLRYLEDQASGWGIRVGLVHGGVADADRHSLRRRFKLPPHEPEALDLMLCSEVGTEGLDYQFCNMLVNYDIPWNPMKIEQRIGRIDRRGQLSESVAVINILTEGTVEADIYNRCLLRIGVFHRAIGGSEEILGTITNEIRRIAEDVSMSEDDRHMRLRQLADNKVARIEELARLEEQQSGLLGLTSESFDDRVSEASSSWLDKLHVSELVAAYLEELLPGRKISLRPGRAATVRLADDTAAKLLSDLAAIGGDAPLERRLRRTPVTFRLTSEQSIAAEDESIDLLDSSHPLVTVAARFGALSESPMAAGRVTSDVVPPGQYPIAIYSWTYLGARDSSTLRYICLDRDIADAAEKLLADAQAVGEDAAVDEATLAAIEERHYSDWETARNKHTERARAEATRKVASLQAQRDRQIRWLEENELLADDPKISKMRQSERATAHDKFGRLIESQQRAASGADLVARQLATVLLEVVAP